MKKQKEGLPYIAVGDGELDGNKDIGETIECPNCTKKHKVKYGHTVLEDGTKEVFDTLAYVSCTNGSAYLVGIEGKENSFKGDKRTRT